MSELVLYGGTILTLARNGGPAEAVLLRDNRIAAVGTEDRVRSLASPQVEELDIEGKTVIPGFNDNHIHAVHMGDHKTRPNLDGLGEEEIVEHLRAHYAGVKPGEWIFGYSWDYPSVPNPHREVLDRAFPENPVMLTQFSGHAAWLNSRALDYFGITKETADWPKGKILKDDTGSLTGVIREPTSNAKIRAFRFKRLVDKGLIRRSLGKALQLLAEAGITSVQDNTWFPQTLKVIKELHSEGKLTCRFSCWAYGETKSLAAIFRLRRFDPHWFASGPTKFFLDGAFSSRSAWLTEPYADEPENYGSGRDSASIKKYLADCVKKGRQCAHHSIGDRATAELCDAVEDLARRFAWIRQLRLRLEHGQIIRDQDIPRLRDLGVLVCAQPSALVDPEKDRRLLGADRALKAYPYRSLLDAGVHLSFGSDYPGEHIYTPLHGIHLVVNREGPEAITVEEALRCYTAESAFAQFAEDEKGTIEVGKLADLTVLTGDPTRVPKDQIKDIAVAMTIVDGKIVYDATAGKVHTADKPVSATR